MSLDRHQAEIQQNLAHWNGKPLLHQLYADFYGSILEHVDTSLDGLVVELGSGIGNLKAHLPQAVRSDLFANPWLDLVCDAYRLPFADDSLSHLVLFDVFHHLERPFAFFSEARRVLRSGGGVIVFEPYMSWSSIPVFGLLHHEPIAWRDPIDMTDAPPTEQRYYAAQGNATRLFFTEVRCPDGFVVAQAKVFACFGYFLSGGYSRRSMYPASWYGGLARLDRRLSRMPRVFGGRCLVELRATKL